MSEWTIHGSHEVYTSPWVTLQLVDVRTSRQSALSAPRCATRAVAATVLLNGKGEVLLMRRHRFTTGTLKLGDPLGHR